MNEGTASQLASIRRTHADDPARTASFKAAVQAGRIPLLLHPGEDEARHTLLVLGLDLPPASLPTPAGGYRHLKPVFLRGTLPGQIETTYRTRATNPGKVAEFRRAIRSGDVVLEAVRGLRVWHLQLLVRLGVFVPPVLVAAVSPQAESGAYIGP